MCQCAAGHGSPAGMVLGMQPSRSGCRVYYVLYTVPVRNPGCSKLAIQPGAENAIIEFFRPELQEIDGIAEEWVAGCGGSCRREWALQVG